MQTLEEHRDNVATVVVSPDGTTLASGDLNAIIHLWDTTHMDNQGYASWTYVLYL